MKTNQLTGAALDWAVAKCEDVYCFDGTYTPSTNWAQGGPIIEREWIELCRLNNGEWRGQWYEQATEKIHREYGDTPLIAAMRCYVASKLGDEVEIPTELTQGEAVCQT